MEPPRIEYDGGMEPIAQRRTRSRIHHGFVWLFLHSWQRRVTVLLMLALVLVGALSALQWRTNDEIRAVRGVTQQQRAQVEQVEDRAKDAAQAASDATFDARAISADTMPSVFTIVAGNSQGTAFALLRDGRSTIFVTNRHVVQDDAGATRSRVLLGRDRAEFEGRVVAVGLGEADVALVRVRAEFPTLDSAATDAVEGDPVLAYGSPLGLSDTRTQGIVSALRDEFIQFDAPVNPGNSGGPLLDRTGAVLGIVTGELTADTRRSGSTGLSFAIDIDAACELAQSSLPDAVGCT